MARFDRWLELLGTSFLTAPAIARIGLFFVAWVALWLPISLPLAARLQWRWGTPLAPSQKLSLVASLYLLAPLVLYGVQQVEGSTWADLGLLGNYQTLGSAGLGLGLGALGIGVLFGVQRSLGWIEWQQPEGFSLGRALVSVVLPTLILGSWVSLTEETIFRGFLLNQLQTDYGVWLSAAIASLIFAVLHLVWDPWRETGPQVPGLWLMGMVLVVARWANGGNLGLAIGLHAGWIWAMATLDTLQCIRYTDRVSPWLTGLGSKPLAGVTGLLFLAGTGAAVWQLGLSDFLF